MGNGVGIIRFIWSSKLERTPHFAHFAGILNTLASRSNDEWRLVLVSLTPMLQTPSQNCISFITVLTTISHSHSHPPLPITDYALQLPFTLISFIGVPIYIGHSPRSSIRSLSTSRQYSYLLCFRSHRTSSLSHRLSVPSSILRDCSPTLGPPTSTQHIPTYQYTLASPPILPTYH